ncbi:major facilitator superfamily domain-containing protein [Cunninghamella echinulata]|nr:major facilitator superfamily domain-containing protein [Cunninghamella echinulata]
MEKIEIDDSINNEEQLDQPFVKSPEEKRFVRKLYWFVLPLIWCVIFIQFVDKAILSVASGTGLLEDTNMTLQQYNWVSGVVYLGYLVYQVPNNILIQILPHSKYLGCIIVLWGIVTCITSICNTFQQMMAVRFLLGLTEAGALPTVYIVLNTLFRRSEHSIVYGFTIMSSGTGTVIGTLIGILIVLYLDGVDGKRAWRWGYLIFGVITIFIGILVFFLLIDEPNSKLLRLTEKEKEIVKDRTKDNMVVKTRKIKRYQILEAFKEARFWCLGLATLLINFQASGLITYSVLLVQSLGFNSVQSVILQLPSGFFAFLFVLIAVVCIRRYNQSIYVGIIFTCLTIIGCIILVSTETVAGKLFGYYLTWTQSVPQATFIIIVGNNVSGYTKKVTYNGAMFVCYVLGSFVGPFFMQDYRYGIVGYIIGDVFVILLLLYIRYDMAKENKKRKENALGEKPDVNLDLTDRENNTFTFIL